MKIIKIRNPSSSKTGLWRCAPPHASTFCPTNLRWIQIHWNRLTAILPSHDLKLESKIRCLLCCTMGGGGMYYLSISGFFVVLANKVPCEPMLIHLTTCIWCDHIFLGFLSSLLSQAELSEIKFVDNDESIHREGFRHSGLLAPPKKQNIAWLHGSYGCGCIPYPT